MFNKILHNILQQLCFRMIFLYFHKIIKPYHFWHTFGIRLMENITFWSIFRKSNCFLTRGIPTEDISTGGIPTEDIPCGYSDRGYFDRGYSDRKYFDRGYFDRARPPLKILYLHSSCPPTEVFRWRYSLGDVSTKGMPTMGHSDSGYPPWVFPQGGTLRLKACTLTPWKGVRYSEA